MYAVCTCKQQLLVVRKHIKNPLATTQPTQPQQHRLSLCRPVSLGHSFGHSLCLAHTAGSGSEQLHSFPTLRHSSSSRANFACYLLPLSKSAVRGSASDQSRSMQIPGLMFTFTFASQTACYISSLL